MTAALPPGVQHGTNYAYGKFKCRCEPCVDNRKQQRRSWASEAARPVSAPVARTDERVWPLEPLQRAAHGGVQEKLKVSGDEWAKARDHGLSDAKADRWATKLRLHPAFVWPGWIDAGLTVLDQLHLYGSDTAEPGWRLAAGYDTPTRQEVAA